VVPPDARLWFLAYGFLALERAHGTATALDGADETDSPFCQSAPDLTRTRRYGRLTLPGIRQGLPPALLNGLTE
jgi:hypothetical protein